MIDLLRAEIVRLLSRRMLRGIAALVIGVMTLIAVITFFQSSNDPSSGLAEAQREVQQCEQQRQFAPSTVQDGGQCPSVEDLRRGFDHRFRYASSTREATRNVAIFLFTVSLLIAASFVGAEWGTGTMTTLLTWEPRRGRLLTAKWIAAAAGCAAFALLALIFLTFVFYPAGAFRGTTAGMTGHWWKDVVFTWLRGAGLAAIGASFGVAFATVARNTAAAAGFGVAYFGIADQLLSFAYNRRFQRWFFMRNIGEFLGIGTDTAPNELTRLHVSSLRAAILMSIYACLAILIAWGAFRSRDVT